MYMQPMQLLRRQPHRASAIYCRHCASRAASTIPRGLVGGGLHRRQEIRHREPLQQNATTLAFLSCRSHTVLSPKPRSAGATVPTFADSTALLGSSCKLRHKPLQAPQHEQTVCSLPIQRPATG